MFTDNMRETIKGFEPEEVEAEWDCCAACYDEKPGKPGAPLIVLTFDAGLADIIHEADHATFFLLKYSNVPVTYDDNEAHAYLLEYIVTKILAIQKKLNDTRV